MLLISAIKIFILGLLVESDRIPSQTSFKQKRKLTDFRHSFGFGHVYSCRYGWSQELKSYQNDVSLIPDVNSAFSILPSFSRRFSLCDWQRRKLTPYRRYIFDDIFSDNYRISQIRPQLNPFHFALATPRPR